MIDSKIFQVSVNDGITASYNPPMMSIRQLLNSKPVFVAFSIIVIYGLFGLDNVMMQSHAGELLWDLNHLAVFFIGNLFLLNLFPQTRPDKLYKILIWLLALFLLSGGIEYMQKLVGRDASWGDIALNMAGSMLAIALFIFFERFQSRIQIAYGIVLLVCATGLTWPHVRTLIAEYVAFRQFPVLADFSNSFAIHNWTSGSASLKVNKQNEMEVTYLLKYDYPGIVYASFHGEWDKYQALVLEIINPEQEKLAINFFIIDRQHGRNKIRPEDGFNKHIMLEPGLNKISIPILDIYNAPESRPMVLNRLDNLVLYMTDLKQPRTILIKKMYLR